MLQASHKSFDPCPQNFRDFEASSVVMARGVGSVSSVTWLVYCSTRFMPTLFCTTPHRRAQSRHTLPSSIPVVLGRPPIQDSRHGTDGSDLIYWSMVLVDVTGASEVPPKNICHPSASPAPSLLRVVVARVRPLSQSCSSPTRRPDQEVDARRGVVNEHSCNTPPATRRVLNQITTEMTRQGWTLHIDTFETFSLNSAFQRLGYA